MTDVLGVLVIARNGDRYEYYQDPATYEPAFTESTPLGAVSMTPGRCATDVHMFVPTLRSSLTSSGPSSVRST